VIGRKGKEKGLEKGGKGEGKEKKGGGGGNKDKINDIYVSCMA